MWFMQNEKEMEHRHLERMKCLEQGLPLPDAELAWVEAIRLRGSQLTAVMIVGTVALAAAPVGATAIMFALASGLPWANVILPSLTVLVWCVCGYLLFNLIQSGMRTLGQLKQPPVPGVRRADGPSGGLKLVPETDDTAGAPSTAVQEGWYARPEAPRGE